MTTEVTWLASPIKDHHLKSIDRDPSKVLMNYLPNSRPPKARDYIVTYYTVSHIDLPEGYPKRVHSHHYLLMTYAFFKDNYEWDPRPGQTPHKTQVCKPKY